MCFAIKTYSIIQNQFQKELKMEIQRSFEILDLDLNASLDEAKLAYKTQVKFFHPDRFNDDPQQKQKAEKKLKEVNMAYENVKSFLSSKLNKIPEQEPKQQENPYMQGQSHTMPKTNANSTDTNEDLAVSSVFRSLFSNFLTAISGLGTQKLIKSKRKTYEEPESFDRNARLGERMGQRLCRGRGMSRCKSKGKGMGRGRAMGGGKRR